MNLNVYSIRDNLAEIFNKPFFDHNNATAIRGFTETAKSQPHKDDYSLYLIGQYNDQTGLITPCEPQRIFTGLEVEASINDVSYPGGEIPQQLRKQAV